VAAQAHQHLAAALLGRAPPLIEGDELLGAIGQHADDYQQTGALVVASPVEMDAVRPPIQVAALTQIALAPVGMFGEPLLLELAQCRRRQPWVASPSNAVSASWKSPEDTPLRYS
jgi:hypothetical protein